MIGFSRQKEVPNHPSSGGFYFGCFLKKETIPLSLLTTFKQRVDGNISKILKFPKQTSPTPKQQCSNDLSCLPSAWQTHHYTAYKGEPSPRQEAVPGKRDPRTWKLSREKAESTEIGGLPSGISSLLLGSQVPQHVLCTRLNMLFQPPEATLTP